MKPDDKLLRLAAALLTATLCAYTAVAGAYDQSRFDEARQDYRLGESAYAAHDYLRAKDAFKRSFDAIPFAETAYFLSATYCKLLLPREAEHFAQAALATSPPLAELQAHDAGRIIEWAHRASAAGYDAKADTQPPAAPQVSLPMAPTISRAPPAEVAAPSALSGVWRFTMKSDVSHLTHRGAITLTVVGTSVRGSIRTWDGSNPQIEGTISGESVELVRDTGMDTIQHFRLTQKGSAYVGTFWNVGKYFDSGQFEIWR